MAGYIFLLNEHGDLNEQMRNGVYSTNMKNPENDRWSSAMEGTIADYMTMKEGDNIYFFQRRKIYGIGELITVDDRVISENFPGSFLPRYFEYEDIEDDLLTNTGEESAINRLACFFRPSPHFFREGVDMDDVLSSAPEKFKMLRLIQQVSFIKVDDEENQALKNIILKRSLNALSAPDADNTFEDDHVNNHAVIAARLGPQYDIRINELMLEFTNVDRSLRHEMLVEVAILYQLSYDHPNAVNIFGSWDHLSHQVGASPFKPISYMDRIDVFGYAYIEGHRPTVERYLVVEIKAGRVTNEDLNQLMKYVDWIKNEYADNEYAPIQAFLLGHSFEEGIEEDADNIIQRNYTIGNRPTRAASWANVKLVGYEVDDAGELVYEPVHDFNVLVDGI